MTNVKAVYPNAIATWTDRIDQVNTVFANDPNSLAAEILAIEKTLGVNPQIEKNPVVGNPVTYSSVDARMSAIQQAQQLPVGVYRANDQHIPLTNNPGGVINSYQALYDPYKMYNGTDVTTPVAGWYLINAYQQWDNADSGWDRTGLYINGKGGLLTEYFNLWDIQGNVPGGLFYKRTMNASVWWQGPLAKGVRISVYSENGTSKPSRHIDYMSLHVSCVQKLPNITIPTAF